MAAAVQPCSEIVGMYAASSRSLSATQWNSEAVAGGNFGLVDKQVVEEAP